MIRNASLQDYASIIRIKNKLAIDISKVNDNNYRIDMESKGFLIPSEYSLEEFERDLSKTFLVYEETDDVVGFIRIDEEPELRKTTQSNWVLPELKDIYFSSPHAEIGGIAIVSEYARKHLASQLLMEAEREVKAKGNRYLFSLIVIAPVMNYPSIRFHEKNDFQRVAVSEPHTLFGMNDYQSILFGKELQKVSI